MLLKFFVFIGAFSFFVATASNLPDPEEKTKLSLSRLDEKALCAIVTTYPQIVGRIVKMCPELLRKFADAGSLTAQEMIVSSISKAISEIRSPFTDHSGIISMYREQMFNLAVAGWSEAQEYVSWNNCVGKGVEWSAFEKLRMLWAVNGNSRAQLDVAIKIADQTKGFTEASPDQLKSIAQWPGAQQAIDGATSGKKWSERDGCYVYCYNSALTEKFAELGSYKASSSIAYGYAHGAFGFSKDLERLMELAEADSPRARYYVGGNLDQLMVLAEKGWKEAQVRIVEHYNQPDTFSNLNKLAIEKRWSEARKAVAERVADGWDMSSGEKISDPGRDARIVVELKKLSLFWPEAKPLMAQKLDLSELKELAELDRANPGSPFVSKYAARAPLDELITFVLGS